MDENICKWHRIDADYTIYDTDCGNAFEIIEGTPKDNDMLFCPYCGKKLKEVEHNHNLLT